MNCCTHSQIHLSSFLSVMDPLVRSPSNSSQKSDRSQHRVCCLTHRLAHSQLQARVINASTFLARRGRRNGRALVSNLHWISSNASRRNYTRLHPRLVVPKAIRIRKEPVHVMGPMRVHDMDRPQRQPRMDLVGSGLLIHTRKVLQVSCWSSRSRVWCRIRYNYT